MHKICPGLDLKMYDELCSQNWSQWVCYECDYTGPIIEGNDDLAEEIHENYLESLEEDDSE